MPGVGDFVQGMTRSSDKSFEQVEAEFFDQVRPTTLIKRFASPQEVASLVAYVASPLASAITGQPFASTAASSRAPSEGLPGLSVKSLLRTLAFEFERDSQHCLRTARPASHDNAIHRAEAARLTRLRVGASPWCRCLQPPCPSSASS